MARYRKFHSKYSLDKKHQSLSDGDTIWEKDWSTVRGPIIGNFGANAKRKYTDGNFTFVTSNIPSPEKKHTIADEGDVYTYEQVSGATRSETINNKQPEYNSNDLRSYAYFGSAYELVKNSIENIVKNFPPKLYTDHSPLEIPPLPGDMDHDITTASDKDGNSLYALSNPFNVDFISQNPSLDDENAMHYMSLSYPFYKVKTYKEGKVDCEYSIDGIEIELVGDKIGDCEESEDKILTIKPPLYNSSSIELIGGIVKGDNINANINNSVTNDHIMVAVWDPDNTDEFAIGRYTQNYQFEFRQEFSDEFDPNAFISNPYYYGDPSSTPLQGYTNFYIDSAGAGNKGACFWIISKDLAYPKKYMGYGFDERNDWTDYFMNWNQSSASYQKEHIRNTIIIEKCPKCTLFPELNVRSLALYKSYSESSYHGLHWHIHYASVENDDIKDYTRSSYNNAFSDVAIGSYPNWLYADEYDQWILSTFVKEEELSLLQNNPKVKRVISNTYSESINGWICVFIIFNYSIPEVSSYFSKFDSQDTITIANREIKYIQQTKKYHFYIILNENGVKKEISVDFTSEELKEFAVINDNECSIIGSTPERGLYAIKDDSVYIPSIDMNSTLSRKFNKYTKINIVRYSGIEFTKI